MVVRELPGEPPAPRTRLIELPGRGVTRIWECAGPPGAPVLMLIHGVTFTAELNWGKSFDVLGRHFRVVAMDLRGHGDGIGAGRGRFRLEDCADDIAVLAQVMGVGPFVAVGYSMGGMVAQLLSRRHAPLLSGLVLCATARNVLGSSAETLTALALPAVAAAVQLNPFLQPMSAEFFGMALLGPVEDPVAARQARAQLRRTSLGTAISAVQAVCEFSSHSWIGQVSVPAAVLVTTRDRVVPVSRQLRLARAIPGAIVHEVAADHAACVTTPEVFNPALLQACWSVTAERPDRVAS